MGKNKNIMKNTQVNTTLSYIVYILSTWLHFYVLKIIRKHYFQVNTKTKRIPFLYFPKTATVMNREYFTVYFL